MREILRRESPPSTEICDALDLRLRAHPEWQCIAVFSALPGEVDLAGLVARHPARRWAYPRVEGDDLVFHAVTHPDTELATSHYGIREPNPDLPVVDPSEIDLFLCPGLAFDSGGGRLGRGRGYYDRTLACAKPTATKIGVGFPAQQVADTFLQPHDIRMDEIISG